MIYLKTFTFFIFLLFFISCSNKMEINPKFTLNNSTDNTIISLKQSKQISIDELIKEVQHYPVIFVVDHHNTIKTHKFFDKFINKLSDSNYNIHLANEWFSPHHNKLLNEFTSDDIDGFDLYEKRKWTDFTSYSWDLVENLYKSVKNNSGNLYGINISKNNRKKISSKNIADMSITLKKIYNNLDLNVSSHQSLVMPFFDLCLKIPSKKIST